MTTPTKFQTLKPTNMTMLFLVGIETGSYISIVKKKNCHENLSYVFRVEYSVCYHQKVHSLSVHFLLHKK